MRAIFQLLGAVTAVAAAGLGVAVLAKKLGKEFPVKVTVDVAEDAEQDDGRGAPDEGDASVLECGEESGADLQADREDEEDEPELLDEVPDLAVDGHAEVAGDDPDEEDPGDAERDALDLDLSEEDAEGDDQCEGQHGMRDAVSEEEGIQPVHI